tara:strand:- start:232 stop:498 length:267 start_codon:yes stop_codon:yes gene_type:complete
LIPYNSSFSDENTQSLYTKKILRSIIIIKKGGVKMGKIIAKNVVDRKSGFLYYVDGAGNVCEAKMARGGKKKKKKAKKKAKKKVKRRR